ncbi:uncharacterized protein LOC129793176 isoform X1 [Lutzomyia longipalpis]|uniref:uncharacterized protein LOC129793176 isoform X1 n=1 Tax=Lutzomyia longipalpis TaxID=7200 RepID=UPI0024839943|nr:uncharacterized protein LOC129793176 isoform X1 [Lutzomyia longipalpis]
MQQHEMMSGKTNEITAEWTVHAQLTLSHPGDGTSTADGDPKPVTVVYKWSSDDVKDALETDGRTKGNVSFSSSSSKRQEADEAHQQEKVPQCKSTCSIVLSACADLFPINAQNKYDPNTKRNFDTVLLTQDQGSSMHLTPRIIPLKDAFSQTTPSDCEVPPVRIQRKSSQTEKRTYDYRRKTESMLSPPPNMQPQTPVDEGKVNSSQYGLSRSPLNRYSPSYTSPTSSKRGGSAKKPPRTVHIDVYCTASDGDEGSSSSSSSVSSENVDPVEDVESNSTPQTVYESQQMKLMHKRVGKFDLPRRLGGNRLAESTGRGIKTNLGSLSKENVQQLSSKSSMADEINESKQILFDKHLGGSSSGGSRMSLRQKLMKDTSDDCLSSNYPNSSYSTFRDMTVSSISSAQASTSALFEDLMETSWKESEYEMAHAPHASSVAQSSDSFEYDNANDRNRIRQMEEQWQRKNAASTDKVWNSPQAERKFLMQQQRMNEFMRQKEQGERMKRVLGVLETDDSEHSGNISESDRGYHLDPPQMAKTLCPNVMIGMGMSVKEPSPASTAKTTQSTNLEEPRREVSEPKDVWPGVALRRPPPTFLNFSRDSESASSSLVSHLSGYTHEYLSKARKFGAVVGALRKPGHHVGPAKNPDCQCEHCRRWMAERDKGRGRSSSISGPLTFDGFRARRNYI